MRDGNVEVCGGVRGESPPPSAPPLDKGGVCEGVGGGASRREWLGENTLEHTPFHKHRPKRKPKEHTPSSTVHPPLACPSGYIKGGQGGINPLKGGLIGCGYFAQNHLHAWNALAGATLTAVCDHDETRARSCAEAFGIPNVYTDPETMLQQTDLDFVDIVTQPATHHALVTLAARHGVPVICQKPLAASLAEARAMVETCRAAAVPLMVHENFRWQTPMRAVKGAASSLGELFFGRIHFRSAHDVYANQPYLATEERFILADLGVHLLDLARFFLGEVAQLTCLTQRVNPAIRGEDVATLLLEMTSGASCVVELSYASQHEHETFPQTLVQLEGSRGSLTLGRDFALTRVTPEGVTHERVAPRRLPWSTPPAEAIQESVLAVQRHWLACLAQKTEPETSGEDNVRTLELVFGAYRSAADGVPYRVGGTP